MEIYNNIKTLVRKYPIPVILNIMGLVLHHDYGLCPF